MTGCLDLPDFTFPDDEIEETVRRGGLLSAEIEITTACNFRCLYCYVPGSVKRTVMQWSLFEKTCAEVKALGARRIVLLGGEPMLHPQLPRMVRHIASLGIVPEIFTNGARLTEDVLELFRECGVILILKFNSLDPELQNMLSGVPDADAVCRNAFAQLQNFRRKHPGEGVFGLSTVICKANYHEIPEIWRLARRHSFLPCIERMNPVGHATEHAETLNCSPQETEVMFRKLSSVDREEFSLFWEPQPPLVGRRCLRNRYSCTIAPDGVVKPCVGVPIPCGNISETPLAEILRTNETIRELRHYRETIKGGCSNCPKGDTCYGCRGTAYQLTGDFLAADPLCWRNQGNTHA